jgi:perosamine synthetase
MIPVNEPLFGTKEKEYLARCIDDKWVSSEGPFVGQLERLMAEYIGVEFGVAVCNGTAALEVALRAIDVRPGDEVILPSFTIISCVLAVLRCGATPILVDSEPDTWTMDVSALERKISKRTKAIMPVHIYGHPVDMDPILDLAKKPNLYVVEDAAEVHGAEYKGRRCGSLGHISCFSFYANKVVTTGEGGMVLTSDKHLAERAKSVRNLCFVEGKRFIHYELGYNFRMSNLQAALGVAQMERIEELLRIKRDNAARYLRLLQGVPGISLPVERPWAKNMYWMFGIVLKETTGMNASEFARRLLELGVDTRPFFYPLHKQPVLQELGYFAKARYPVSEQLSEYGLYLPSGLTLTPGDIDHVVDAIKMILQR